MQSQLPKTKDDATNSPAITAAIESIQQPQLSPAARSIHEGLSIVTQVVAFLAHLSNYLGRFFNTYSRSLVGVVLVLAAFVALRVVLAAVDALNDIPLIAPTFELVGLAYTSWFGYRYLLTASKRQEVLQLFEKFLKRQAQEVIRTDETEQLYKPGEIVPTSGRYAVINPDGNSEGREVTSTRGEHFPPTPEPGMHYQLVDETLHKGNQEFLSQPQKDVMTIGENEQLYKPGEIVPTSGQYSLLNPDGSSQGREVTATKGEHFPPTPESGMRYMLVDPTRHQGN